MKLGFLANATQLNTKHKSLPLHQVEAVVVFGNGVQKAKVLAKL